VHGRREGNDPGQSRLQTESAMWHGGVMPEYERFSRFYDAVMDDPAPRAARVHEYINRYLPDAASLLELGCGTGSILAHLTTLPSLTGLDRSPEMLALAREKVPSARLIEGDMSSFSLGERFDVVICVFDSLNHLLTFDAWQSMFTMVCGHLVEGGLFIFDVNTLGELRRLGEEPPWVYDFDENVLIMNVSFADDGMSQWDIRIFENVGESQYLLHHEQIGELGVSLLRIKSALEPKFVLLEEASEVGEPPTDNSVKAHFAYRRLP
jgi:SAM-dependent methyltransferase